jgi:uncharacterized protein (TIGR02246 family)
MDTATATFAHAAAGIRAVIAAYAQAVDDGRPADVAATFCPDGSVDLPGVGTFAGHDAIRSGFAGLDSHHRSRHVVVNTHITAWHEDRATSISDLVVLATSASGWTIHLVGRYRDELHCADGQWRFHTRQLEFAGVP